MWKWLIAIAACGSPPRAPEPLAHHADEPALHIWHYDAKAEPFAVVGDAVLAWDSKRDGIAYVSMRDGVETRFRKLENASVDGTPHTWEPVAGGYIANWDEELVFVRDQGGVLAQAWKTGDDYWYQAVGGGSTVWVAQGRARSSISAVAVADGTVRWRHALPADVQDLTIAGNGEIVMSTHEEYQQMPPSGRNDIHRIITALRANDGATLWRVELPTEPNTIRISSDGAAVTLADSLQLYDASGAMTELPFTHQTYPSIALAGGVAYVDDYDAHTIAAYRLRGGNMLWRTVRATGAGAGIVVHGDLVVVSTDNDTVLALDRASGAPRWEVGVGTRASHLTVSDAGVVVFERSSAVGFALPGVQPARETATIRGRVRRFECMQRGDVVVDVGDQRATLDADGRYTATVTAAGIVLVRTPGHTRDPNEERRNEAAIELRGSGNYEVPDLDADWCPSE